MAAVLITSFAVPLTEAETTRLREMASDLRFLLSEHDVHDRIQLRLHALRYRNLKTFAVMADDRPGVRTAVSADIIDSAEAGLTPDQIATARVVSAQLLSAWVSASTKDLEEVKAAAENKVMRLPALVSKATLISFRQKFEREHGRQNDGTWPCASMIEKRLEECEEGVFNAQPLSEVICVDAAGEEASDITEIGNSIRLRRAPKAIPLPVTTEQLRTRMRTLAVSYVVAGYKHASRLWLRTATLPVFLQYVEYILGDQVAGYVLDQEGVHATASWPTVLTYEINIRKATVRAVLYDDLDFEAALLRSCRDLSVKERFFTTPTAIISANRTGRSGGASRGSDSSSPKPEPKSAAAKRRARKTNAGTKTVVKTVTKAEGRGQGKGKGQSKGQMQKTPDGRLICGFVNTPQGCVKSTCQFLHVCNVCYSPGHVAGSPDCPGK